MNGPQVTTVDAVMLDVRDRLARIEVKIDNSNEKLRDHDTRIDALETDVIGMKARHSTSIKIAAAAIPACAAVFAWLWEHVPLTH